MGKRRRESSSRSGERGGESSDSDGGEHPLVAVKRPRLESEETRVEGELRYGVPLAVHCSVYVSLTLLRVLIRLASFQNRTSLVWFRKHPPLLYKGLIYKRVGTTACLTSVLSDISGSKHCRDAEGNYLNLITWQPFSWKLCQTNQSEGTVGLQYYKFQRNTTQQNKFCKLHKV